MSEPLPASTMIDEDIPCPRCAYNLRGLTVPRCPECGHTFEWGDLAQMRSTDGADYDIFVPGLIAAAVLIGVPLLLLVVTVTPLLIIILPIVVIFALSFVQSCIEFTAAAAPLLEITRRHFRAWWEGVLIGYGACGLLFYASGWTISAVETRSTWPQGFWPYFVAGAVLAAVIQWAVVCYRLRGWGEAVSARRLLLAVLGGKLLAELVWLFVPLGILRA